MPPAAVRYCYTIHRAGDLVLSLKCIMLDLERVEKCVRIFYILASTGTLPGAGVT